MGGLGTGRDEANPGNLQSMFGERQSAASGHDPSRITNAKLMWIVADLQRSLAREAAHLTYGAWNPSFCAADATSYALRVFADIKERLNHWEKIARDSGQQDEAPPPPPKDPQ